MLTAMQELKGHEGKGSVARARRRPRRRYRHAVVGREARRRGGRTRSHRSAVRARGRRRPGRHCARRPAASTGVPAIVVTHERPGDQWRKRCRCACTTRSGTTTCHIAFPQNWPVFAPKDKIGDWLSSTPRSWRSRTGRRPPACRRPSMRAPGGPSRSTVTASESHCIRRSWCWPPGCRAECAHLAGAGRLRRRPASLERPPRSRPLRRQARRRDGSNNSAHDICKALYENGVDVTMGSALDPYRQIRFVDGPRPWRPVLGAGVASGMTTEKADLTFASLPYRIMHEFQIDLQRYSRAGRGLLRAADRGGLRTRLG